MERYGNTRDEIRMRDDDYYLKKLLTSKTIDIARHYPVVVQNTWRATGTGFSGVGHASLYWAERQKSS
jgi:hypothetical protein